jgi:hypothetical protein
VNDFLRDSQALWDRHAAADPLWAILSDPAKKDRAWNLGRFFETGVAEVGGLLYELTTHGVDPARESALDFGCGVGRLAQALVGWMQTPRRLEEDCSRLVPSAFGDKRADMKLAESAPSLRRLVVTAALGAFGLLPSTLDIGVRAQSPAVKFDVRAARGQMVAPIYEGWWEAGGTKYALFSYYNRNIEEVVDVPVGSQNVLAPGPPDQGQPTRFFPGIYYGVFAIALPKDQPKPEATWTLTVSGHTVSIPVSVDPLYLISPQEETGSGHPGNTPPIVKFDPAGPSGQGPLGVVVSRTAIVSRPLALDAWVTDDGQPPARPGTRPPAAVASLHLGAWGLALRWQVYRGSGTVRFSDPAPELKEGVARTTVTFSEPGDYMLQLLAIDSRTPTRCCWTNGYVRVKVERK